MDDVFNIARELQQMPDLLPWVIFAVVCIVFWTERPTIKDYFISRTEYWKSKKICNSSLPELIRNNTETLNMCKEMLKTWESDRGEARALIIKNENMISENSLTYKPLSTE